MFRLLILLGIAALIIFAFRYASQLQQINPNAETISGGKITFFPFGTSPFQLWIANDDATNLVKLYTANNAGATVSSPPAISPDLNWVLFDEDPDGEGSQPPVIKKLSIVSQAVTTLGIGGHPSWSSDGTKIIYCDLGTGKIGIMQNDGSNKVDLWGDINYESCDPSWSPDGTKIAFKAHRLTDPDLKASIFVIDVNPDGSSPRNLRQLTNLNWQYSDHDPTWSPDSQSLVFHRFLGTGPWSLNSGANWNSFKINLTGVETQLTFANTDQLNGLPVYSPSGSEIMFFNNSATVDNCPIPVYRMNSDGSSQRLFWGNPPSPLLCSIFYDWRSLPSLSTPTPTPTPAPTVSPSPTSTSQPVNTPSPTAIPKGKKRVR